MPYQGQVTAGGRRCERCDKFAFYVVTSPGWKAYYCVDHVPDTLEPNGGVKCVRLPVLEIR